MGCGFGGLFAARALKRAPVRVTIIDRTNHHLFQPLLYQVATGILSEGQIAPAIRDVLRRMRNLRVVLGEVARDRPGRPHRPRRRVRAAPDHRVRQPHRRLWLRPHLLRARRIPPRRPRHEDARRRHGAAGRIFGAFELAEAEPDEDKRRALMTFVVVGGGPTGVEMAGQLRELARRALHRNYRRIDTHQTRVVLVEGGDGLVASMGKRLSRITARDLERMGVEIHFGAMVTDMDDRCVVITKRGRLDRAHRHRHQGVGGRHQRRRPGQDAGRSGRRRGGQGRAGQGPTGLLPGLPPRGVRRRRPDGARRPARPWPRWPCSRAPMPPTPLSAGSRERSPSRFHYRDLGTLAVISRFTAVAKVGPIRVGGFLGWLIWLVVHITFLTGFKNRFGALARWTISFIGRGRYERALTGRWVAGRGGTDDPA